MPNRSLVPSTAGLLLRPDKSTSTAGGLGQSKRVMRQTEYPYGDGLSVPAKP